MAEVAGRSHLSAVVSTDEEEREVRQQLAALYRLFVHFGWTDITDTHIAARLPSDPDHYLLNPHDLMFDEITASNLIKVSFDGQVVQSDAPLNEAGHIIHTAVLNARPDVNFSLHSHTRAGIAVSAMKGGLRPISQHAALVLGSLATHPYQDSTLVENECELLGRDLGDCFAMLMENHGLLTVGRTAAEAFRYHYFLEMACKIQVDILSSRAEPIEIAPDALKPLIDWADPGHGPKGDLHWAALMRMLDRKCPDYKD